MKHVEFNNIQEQLYNLGLTEYEARVYNELLQISKSGATKLAKLSNISRGRIYDVLYKLVEKGFCKIISGSKNIYQAISPEIAIDNYLFEFKADMQKKQKDIENSSILLQNIYNTSSKDEHPLDHVQVLTSNSAIKERIIQLQYECKKILRVFIKEPLIMGTEPKDSKDRLADQIKKNMKIKQIFEYDKKLFKEYATSIFKAREIGADFDVRVTMTLPLKLIIHDDEHAIFTLNKDKQSSNNYSVMSVSNTYLTIALIELFEFYWNSAIPLEEFIKEHPITD